jgi:hypothetical protein
MAASICGSTTSSSITLWLSPLDTNWGGKDRTVNWYIAQGYPPTEYIYDDTDVVTISGAPPSGGYTTFYGLEESTRYHILCTVYKEDGTLLLSTRADFTTDYEVVEPPVVTPWGDYYEEGTINVSTSSEYVDIYNPYTQNYQLEPYSIHRYKVVFAYSGYAYFYTQSDIDTIGYLSDEPDWNSDYSGPLSDIASDDDSGDDKNFEIKHYVKANIPYYIFVRGVTGEESGYVTLQIIEPWQLELSNYGTLYGAESETITLKPLTLYCREMYFSSSGTVTISATQGSIWIGKSSDWKYGMPTDYFKYSNGFANNSFSCEVTTNQVYFVWLSNNEPSSVTTTLQISAPIVPSAVTHWDWEISNGSASAYETEDAFYAVRDRDYTNKFSHNVWNDLVNKVKDVLAEKGMEWDYTWDSYENTRMTISPYELTAKMFNSLRNNIELVGVEVGIGKITNSTTPDEAEDGTIPHPVKKDNIVFGHYFLTLADYINDCIDKL